MVIPSAKALVLGSARKKGSKTILSREIDPRYNLDLLKIKSHAGTIQREGVDTKRIFYRDGEGNFRVLINE